MKPFSNRFSIILLIIALGLLAYFLIDLATILGGVAVISSPIYVIYITIGILAFLIVSLVILFILSAKWERSWQRIGDV